MPAALRKKGLPTKIVYSILGKPEATIHYKTKEQKEIDRRLVFWNTARVR